MTLYTAQGGWTTGYALCQVWLCVDYLMSNASVMNLLLISFDRFYSVTQPLTYRPRRTVRWLVGCSQELALLPFSSSPVDELVWLASLPRQERMQAIQRSNVPEQTAKTTFTGTQSSTGDRNWADATSTLPLSVQQFLITIYSARTKLDTSYLCPNLKSEVERNPLQPNHNKTRILVASFDERRNHTLEHCKHRIPREHEIVHTLCTYPSKRARAAAKTSRIMFVSTYLLTKRPQYIV